MHLDWLSRAIDVMQPTRYFSMKSGHGEDAFISAPLYLELHSHNTCLKSTLVNQLATAQAVNKAYLAPSRPLLVAVTNLIGSLSNGKVLLNVAAVPSVLLHLHTQSKVLCQGVLGRPTHLQQSIGPHQKVGSCTASNC